MKIPSTYLILVTLILGLTTSSSAWGEKKRQKVIDFDDEVIEGVNKRPFDSLSHISDAEKNRKKSHLYRKRGGFSTETTEALKTFRFIQ